MSNYRIPPSLSWLIRNQRVIAGQIETAQDELGKIEKQIEAASELAQRHKELQQLISILTSDLAAIERSMSLHKIPIELSRLNPVKSHTNPSVLAYGELTRLIFAALGKNPQQWLSTTKIVAYIMANASFQEWSSVSAIRTSTRTQLKKLFYKGKVERIKKGVLSHEGFWRQKPSHDFVTCLESLHENDCLDNNLDSKLTIQN